MEADTLELLVERSHGSMQGFAWTAPGTCSLRAATQCRRVAQRLEHGAA